jgi:hypothetical protein
MVRNIHFIIGAGYNSAQEKKDTTMLWAKS